MYKLSPQTPFQGFALELTGLSLREISGCEIISLAVANGHGDDFEKQAQKLLGAKPPMPGTWVEIDGGKLLWSGQNQYFLIRTGEDAFADKTIAEQMGDNIYCTLQSDGWAGLDISGTYIFDALEKFTALDLREAAPGFAARTTAHHIAVIILKTGEHSVQMLTPRSSAASFLQALTGVIDADALD